MGTNEFQFSSSMAWRIQQSPNELWRGFSKLYIILMETFGMPLREGNLHGLGTASRMADQSEGRSFCSRWLVGNQSLSGVVDGSVMVGTIKSIIMKIKLLKRSFGWRVLWMWIHRPGIWER